MKCTHCNGNGSMTERPILFTGPMVRAILEGRKTQTRRIVPAEWGNYRRTSDSLAHNWRQSDGKEIWLFDRRLVSDWRLCPYGQPGDRLWVRETWQHAPHSVRGYCYRADYAPDIADESRWIPSIHMPRRASRLTLEVLDVRVQRVQEITPIDSAAEGMERLPLATESHLPNGIEYLRNLFRITWDSINAKRGYGWTVNPWVWVVEFKRVEDSK